MNLVRLGIPDVIEIRPVRRADSRGYFSEVFRADWFSGQIASVDFVQENQSLSRSTGIVRGLHCQAPPLAQGKLVRCLAGEIFDVVVDIRRGSPSFGQWVAATLTGDEGNQLWVPAGFLHGFCTLTPDTVVSYRVSAYYDADSDRGVRWNDPDIGIVWPDAADAAHLSPRDAQLPSLADLPILFDYHGGA